MSTVHQKLQHKRTQIAGVKPTAYDPNSGKAPGPFEIIPGQIFINMADEIAYSVSNTGKIFPFMGGGSVTNITVNNIAPDASGNITLPAPSIPDLPETIDEHVDTLEQRLRTTSLMASADGAGMSGWEYPVEYPVNTVGWALKMLWKEIMDKDDDPTVSIVRAYFVNEGVDPIVSIARAYFLDLNDPIVSIDRAYFLQESNVSFSLTPATYEYPDTDVGGSTTVDLTITNTGTADINGFDIDIVGDFVLSGTTCNTLAPGDSCKITIAFEPKSSGLKTGSVTVRVEEVYATTTLTGKTAGFIEPLPRISTLGNQFVDPQGRPVRLSSANWFGAEGTNYTPHGTWARSWKSILDQIKELGFNSIRLPFSGSFCTPGRTPPLTAIDWDENPEFVGKTSIEIFDLIIEYCGRIGLYVVLDHHRREAGDGADGSPISGSYTATQWINNWKMLAARYKDDTTVVGADVHNEPHDLTWDAWASLAEQCGNAILEVAPDWIIFVEGVGDYNGNFYWWGGQLEGVKDRPVQLTLQNRLAYSPHEYGQSVGGQSWLAYDNQTPPANWPNNLYDVWYKNWSFIHYDNIAPIWIGEYGGKFGLDGNGNLTAPNRVPETTWVTELMKHLNGARNSGDPQTGPRMSAAYWSYNPNSADTGGLLQDDWITVQEPKMILIAPVFEPTPVQTFRMRVTSQGKYRITSDGKIRIL